jgi:hypothetical protein
LLLWAVLFEVAYLVVFNGLLRLPLTQDLVNRIRPDRFQVAWDEAWTFYPFRVHVRGGYANGNASSQIWEIAFDEASGSISLWQLPLLRVVVHDVDGRDLVYRQRPRPQPGRDYTLLEPWYPEIKGRAVTAAQPPKPKKWYAWKIVIDDLAISGRHQYWIHQLRGSLDGSARARLRYRAPGGGPLELDITEITAELQPHYLQGEELLKQASLTGSLGFAPYMPREHKDVTLLNYLRLDLNAEFDARSLAFMDLLLLEYPGMKVDGRGAVSGRLRFEQGEVMSGTDLDIDADDLQLTVLGHDITGQGAIRLRRDQATGGELDLAFRFRDLEVRSQEEQHAVLVGQELLLRTGGDSMVVPTPGKLTLKRSIGLEIDSLFVPDLALLQRYLPPPWPLTLHGGEGLLGGMAKLSPTSLDIDLRLDSENADVGIGPYRFLTNLDAGLVSANPDVRREGSQVGGSFLVLSNARLAGGGVTAPAGWSASLMVEQGEIRLVDTASVSTDDNVIDLIQVLADAEARQVLDGTRGRFDFTGHVSSLAWLDVFLQEDYRTRVLGSSSFGGRLHIEAGMPAPDTHVELVSEALEVGVLDYLSRGDGRIVLDVMEGGEKPDWSFELRLGDADLRRRGETLATIQDVDLELDALLRDVGLEPDRAEDQGREYELALRIPRARVTDMSVFNRYLPPDAPLQIVGGEADLSADIALQHDDADGWLRLVAEGADAVADEQQVVLDLDVDVRLVGGVPADMQFDFDGTRVTVDNVRVTGERQDFDEDRWSAVLTLKQARTVWQDPPLMSFEADLAVSDSRPFVALFANQGWRPEFLTRALTVEDLVGYARLDIADDSLAIPTAVLTSEEIELGGKGRIGGDEREGVVYARYKKADALIRIRNGRRNLDVLDARGKYERYQVPP